MFTNIFVRRYQMCRHVREGEAKAYGRHKGNPRCPKDYGKGHCRECTLRRYPKQKVRKPRLWPSCTMPRCRRRHHAWGMCATCLTVRRIPIGPDSKRHTVAVSLRLGMVVPVDSLRRFFSLDYPVCLVV